MRYITSIERLAREEGRREALLVVYESLLLTLELKFGEAGLVLAKDLEAVTDFGKLRTILQQIRTATSVEEVRSRL